MGIRGSQKELSMKNRVLSLIILSLFCVTMLAACVSDPSEAIVGSWECKDTSQPHDWMCEFSFSANGIFIDYDGDGGNYKISGNELTLEYNHYEPISVKLRFMGRNRLNLQKSDDNNQLELNINLHRR